ncbi:MAG: tripartite tricarboxylate transporter substrate binding protein [Cupriavidus sp.]|nr:tripartite tricarboxylate transporter substrate binding protein [Cupriavidus sp.]QWE97781.1 tripartite tricarboxylate transporter substrate binding protein [Cupriavidus sp. EM10]MCA3198733.1 tripartite tricarboxylate transporter substrate binding protein [Cupriavidus sp.]MCA3201479.1 tripartite tricarboxylate transporter substrate binding protein [Cupriavidus sp.]MCA3207648.1 tripartite tricarboxylate transporter substrate binding protein [Cupriavidus sp.]
MATTWLLACALTAGVTVVSPARAADDYPTKPVRVVVAFTAGGTTDMLARSVSQQLAQRFKQSFVVDNRPGAGGNIGTEFVVRSPADGYTMLVNSVGPISINQTLYKKLNYDPLTDLVPVVQIADVPNVLVVHPSLPVKSFDEFVAYAKANPGKLNYSSTGVGTSSHLSGFMLTERIGTQATHIPYKGADALNDLLSGRVQFMFATIPSVMPHIQAGKLRALAVSSAKRSRSLPDLPTVAEKGFPGFEAGSWFGFFAPKGTPQDVITKINQAVNEALPSLQAQMIREGADPVGGSPKQFGDFTRKEYVKWKAVVKASGATVD